MNINRDNYLAQLILRKNNGMIKVVTGIRRCGKSYLLTELGELKADDGETEFSHIPDWYEWERECVRQEILDGTYKYEDDVVSVILPEGTTVIGKDSFDRCNRLQEVHLPYTVKHIGEGAFQGLPSLRTVTLPEGLESIGLTREEINKICYYNFYNRYSEFPFLLRLSKYNCYIFHQNWFR